ncbi:MAG TPA: helix-turn-helix transcriptional regulator [Epulopiscium sp.]|nr:helix-turn-helix transcriptional regulator [Candidatus Epulonipiscium sp.]
MKSEDMVVNSLGSAICMARTKKGLTQKELANLLGVHKETIYSLEKDDRLLRMNYLKQLGEILDMDLAAHDDYYKFAINTSQNLKKVRENLGMTFAQFADFTGINVTSIRRMENGEYFISKKYFNALKEKLGHDFYISLHR